MPKKPQEKKKELRSMEKTYHVRKKGSGAPKSAPKRAPKSPPKRPPSISESGGRNIRIPVPFGLNELAKPPKKRVKGKASVDVSLRKT